MATKVRGITIELGADTSGLQTALKNVNTSLSSTSKQLKDVNNLLKLDPTNTTLLAQKMELLKSGIESAKSKIDTLTQAEESLRTQMEAAGGGSDEQKKQLAALEREIIACQQESDKYEKELSELDDTQEDTSDSAEKAKDSENKLGKVFSTVAKAAAAAAAAVGAAAVALTKEIVESYAEYEQLVGGIETLFEESATTVEKYAENAYKTAGLSANEYMETVTSFSASLIQSLGGDTEAAAEMADMAITDMSDNANKMGTDMESIQNAYQGFAKQNYTMLDNLKLGYGGTQEEMQRLIDDANELKEVQGEVGDLSIDSYADVVEAIHLVQTEIGITGTTAEEAEKTISGSISTLSASWENLITGMGDSEADIEELVDNVAEAFDNVASNITPIVKNIIKALPKAVKSIASAISELLPDVLATVAELFEMIVQAIVELMPQLIPVVISAIQMILQAFVDNLPMLLEGIMNLITEIIPAILEMLPTIIDAILGVLPQLIEELAAALPIIIQAIADALPQIIDAILEAIPAIITALCDAIPDIVIAIIEILPELIVQIAEAIIDNFGPILEAALLGLANILNELATWFLELIGFVDDEGDGIWDDVGEWFANIGKDIWDWLCGIIEDIGQFFSDIFSNIGTWLKESIWDPISDFFSNAWQLGKQLVTGLWDGISGAAEWLWNKISGWISGIWGGIKDFFGIHSPSTEMAWIGEMLDKGLANGIEDNADVATDAADDMVNGINDAMLGLSNGSVTASISEVNGMDELNAQLGISNDSLSGVLGSILTALQNGQNIYIDGDKLVGYTVKPMDAALGRLAIIGGRG